MQFTRSELEMIYKYEATTKEDTVKAMRDEQSVARDDLTRIIIVGRRIEGDINGKLFFQPFSH